MLAPRLALALSLLAACGSSARDPNGPDAGIDAAPTCTPAARTTTLTLAAGDTSWSLQAVASASSVLASRGTSADGAMHVGLLDASGATELAAIPGAAQYELFAAPTVRPDGTSCAVAISGNAGLVYACADGSHEAAGITDTDAEHPPVPVWQPDGTLSVFTQTFAAFTELRRAPTAAWSRIEEFESSISFPTDAVLDGGDPVACFIDDGGYAVIAHGDIRLRSTSAASTCRLALDGGTLHVATESAYAAIPAAMLDAEPGGTFDLTPVAALAAAPDRVIVSGGTPYALVRSTDPGTGAVTLSAVPLPTGQPMVLATTPDDIAVSGWDPDQRAAILASSATTPNDAGGATQTITTRTACMP